MVLLLFHGLRATKNDVKSDLQYSTPKKMPNMLNMTPLGLRLGVIFDTFGGLFCRLFFDAKKGTLEEYGGGGQWPHRGGSKRLLN